MQNANGLLHLMRILMKILKRKIIEIKIITIVLLLICSCASTRFTQLASVMVYTEAPSFKYEALGTIAGYDEDYSDLIEELQARALKMGGNALIIKQQGKNLTGSSAVVGTESAVVGGGSSNEKIYILATVIKVE